MLTVTNAVTLHRLPFPTHQDVNSHHSVIPAFSQTHAFPVAQPFQKFFGGTSPSFNPLPQTKLPTLPPIPFPAFIPATSRVITSVATSHNQGLEPQFLTPHIDHAASLPQSIVVNNIPFKCHLNSSTMTQMDVSTHRTRASLPRGTLTRSTPPNGDISEKDRHADNTSTFPMDFIHLQLSQIPASRQCTLQCVRDAERNNDVEPSSNELENGLEMIDDKCRERENDENILKAIPQKTVSSAENLMPISHNFTVSSGGLKSEYTLIATPSLNAWKSSNQSNPSNVHESLSDSSKPIDQDNSQKGPQDESCNGDTIMESLARKGFEEIVDTEDMLMILDETSQPNKVATLREKKKLFNSHNGEMSVKSVNAESRDALVVKSLRHSIESILNTNKRTLEHTVKLNVERQEMIGLAGDQNDDEYAERSQMNVDVEEFAKTRHRRQEDYDSDDSIYVIGEDEKICDDKGDVEIDVISCESHSCTLPTNVNYNMHDRLSPMSEGRSSSSCSRDDLTENELMIDGREITNSHDKQQKLNIHNQENHFKPHRQSHINAETSHLRMNEHLKGLESLLAKKDVDHFQKDEFFQAKMQVLQSVSKECNMTSTDLEVKAGQEIFSPSAPRANCCMTFPSIQSSAEASNIPPCTLTGVCNQNVRNQTVYNPHCFPCRTREPIVRDADQHREDNTGGLPEDLKEDLQRSAFKPIVKKSHPSQIIPSRVPCQSKANSHIAPALLNCQPKSHPSIRVPVEMLIPSSEDMQFPKLFPNVSNGNSIDESVNLDAISLLRFRSKNYQCSGTQDSPFAFSLSPRPNAEAVTMWLSWLGNRNSGAVRNNAVQPMSSVLSKVPPPPRYHCGDCNKTYSTYGGLSKHRQFHCALHVKKEFACKICTKSYSSLGALKMHIRTHTLPCKCHICGKAFSRPWLLQGHVRTHTGEKPFRCNHCGRAFADRSNLRAHLQTHAEIKKYACVKCGKTFSRMSLLTKHSDGSCPANTSQSI